MFSSTSLIPFLPHLISSFSSNTSPLVADTNRFSFPPKNDAHLFDSLNNMASPPPLSHAMVTNHVDHQHNLSASSSTVLIQSSETGSKPVVKKDRHSKICTAQGLRDRRVRLSIGIARKFFDLQDILGFDKASETLEWLLNKSKKAIKEVHEVGTNNNNNINGSSITSIATSSTCEVVSLIGSKSGGHKKLQRSSSLNVSARMAKESRAKARARARERTRVKMYSKRSPRSDVLDQNNQTCEKLKLATYDHQLEEPNKDTFVTEESSFMVIKRKLKPNTGIVGTYHQNHVMLKDISCINSNNSINLMNSPQNWDFSSAIARSSFCAITNINPSTGLQHLCRKLWEAECSYCPN